MNVGRGKTTISGFIFRMRWIWIWIIDGEESNLKTHLSCRYSSASVCDSFRCWRMRRWGRKRRVREYESVSAGQQPSGREKGKGTKSQLVRRLWGTWQHFPLCQWCFKRERLSFIELEPDQSGFGWTAQKRGDRHSDYPIIIIQPLVELSAILPFGSAKPHPGRFFSWSHNPFIETSLNAYFRARRSRGCAVGWFPFCPVFINCWSMMAFSPTSQLYRSYILRRAWPFISILFLRHSWSLAPWELIRNPRLRLWPQGPHCLSHQRTRMRASAAMTFERFPTSDVLICFTEWASRQFSQGELAIHDIARQLTSYRWSLLRMRQCAYTTNNRITNRHLTFSHCHCHTMMVRFLFAWSRLFDQKPKPGRIFIHPPLTDPHMFFQKKKNQRLYFR